MFFLLFISDLDPLFEGFDFLVQELLLSNGMAEFFVHRPLCDVVGSVVGYIVNRAVGERENFH